MKLYAVETRNYGAGASGRRSPIAPAQTDLQEVQDSESPAALWTPSEDSDTIPAWKWDQDSNTPFWKKDSKNTTYSAKSATARKAAGPRDDSGRLTKRLVSAESSEEVRLVLSEAYENLAQLRLAALSSDAKESRAAMNGIKRLNKLIQRAHRKLSDLGKETLLRQKRERAEERCQEQHVEEIKQELKRRLIERKNREKGYLRDAHVPNERDRDPFGVSSAALEAKISALAELMAQSSAAPTSITVGADASASAASTVAEGGGAAASGTDAGAGAEAAVPAE